MTGEREHREKRLIGLSVVLDGRLAMPAMAGVAGIVARLGLDGIWWRQPPLAGPPPSAADAPAMLSALAGGAGQTRAGLILDLTLPEVATAAATGWTDPWLAAAATQGARLVLTGPPERIGACLRGLPVGRLPQVAVDFRAGKHTEAVLVPVSAGRDLDAEIPAAVAAAGGGPVLVELPVSIGRTAAEAHARATARGVVRGHGPAVGAGAVRHPRTVPVPGRRARARGSDRACLPSARQQGPAGRARTATCGRRGRQRRPAPGRAAVAGAAAAGRLGRQTRDERGPRVNLDWVPAGQHACIESGHMFV